MSAQQPLIILASQSRYRASLLAKLGLDFTQQPADVDESPLPDEGAEALCVRLAVAKARAIQQRQPAGAKPSIIIGSDQVVCVPGDTGYQMLGKPGTSERAREQLAMLSGRCVSFFTSLCVLRSSDDQRQEAVDETRVHFRELTSAQIQDYVAREQPLDCAGAFKSEALGIALFHKLETQDPNALIGLPLIQLCTLLSQAGVPILGPR